MKVRPPESETFRQHDDDMHWHTKNPTTEDHMQPVSYFWQALIVALWLACSVILVAYFALAEPSPFRTDQYVPPVVQRPLSTSSEAYIPPQQPPVYTQPCQK